MVTEGEVTEPQYFKRWASRLKGRWIVTLREGRGNPESVLDRARRLSASARREGRPYAAVWCVFDADEHEHLMRTVAAAAGQGFEVALSSPCFELWLLLHVEATTAPLTSKDAQDRAEARGLVRGKHLTVSGDWLHARHAAAVRRADDLEERHRANGTPRPANPSSDVADMMKRLL